MSYIYTGMGWILKQLYYMLDGIGISSFALAIILFTILINLIFLPININQQKTTAKQTALRPKLDALKEKCGDDKQKYNMEMQELYKREGVKMMGGCLPQLIRLPFLWGVWQAIRSPISYVIGLSSIVEPAKAALIANVSDFKGVDAAKITELDVIQHFDKIKDGKGLEGTAEKISSVNFDFFGLDLTMVPEFTLNFSHLSGRELALWIIPLLSFATAMLSSIVSLKMQKKINPDAGSMGGIMLLMPVLSLVIAFSVPAAVGFYWACSNVVTMFISIAMNKFLAPYSIIARNEATLVTARRKKEKEILAKAPAVGD